MGKNSFRFDILKEWIVFVFNAVNTSIHLISVSGLLFLYSFVSVCGLFPQLVLMHVCITIGTLGFQSGDECMYFFLPPQEQWGQWVRKSSLV